MEIIFVRHGETQHNKKHQLMGQRIDDPLDPEGLLQAGELFSKLPKKLDRIFSSPLKRARQTAQIISKHLNVPVTISDLLKERDFGSLSGKTWEEIEHITGRDMHSLDEHLQYDYTPFNGESYEHVKGRLLQFLDNVRKNHAKEKFLVVTHFGMIMIMDKMFPNKDSHGIGNVSIHKYKI